MMTLSGLWDLNGEAKPKFLSFLQCVSLTLVIFLSLPTRKRQHMCAKSIIDNLFLISFLRAMNCFFFLEIIEFFSLIFYFNNCLWHCLYVLEKQRLLLATLKLRNFGIRLFCWQDFKKSKSASFFSILKSNISNLCICLTISSL